MANEKNDLPAKEKKEAKIELRDLKPKKDVKGGTRQPGHGEKHSPAKTGEMDFMNWD